MMLNLRIYDRLDAELLSARGYSEMKLREEVENLAYTRMNPGGPGTLTFDIKRNPRTYWPDLQPANIIRLFDSDDIAWEGSMFGVNRNIETSAVYQVNCVGFCSRMKRNGTEADLDLDVQAEEKGSTWMVDHMLTNEHLGYSEGDVQTTDWESVTGISFFPGKSYWDEVEEINRYNDWLWRLRVGKAFDFIPKPPAVTVRAYLKNASKSTFDKNLEYLYNWAQFAWTGDGETYGYVTSEDTDSQDDYGMSQYWGEVPGLCTEEEAQQYADIFVERHSELRPAAAITTDLITNENGAPLSIHDVLEGEMMEIRDLDTDETVDRAWNLAEVTVNADTGFISLSPGGPFTSLEVLLARFEERQL